MFEQRNYYLGIENTKCNVNCSPTDYLPMSYHRVGSGIWGCRGRRVDNGLSCWCRWRWGVGVLSKKEKHLYLSMVVRWRQYAG